MTRKVEAKQRVSLFSDNQWHFNHWHFHCNFLSAVILCLGVWSYLWPRPL